LRHFGAGKWTAILAITGLKPETLEHACADLRSLIGT
jgi:hypothetical protein